MFTDSPYSYTISLIGVGSWRRPSRSWRNVSQVLGSASSSPEQHDLGGGKKIGPRLEPRDVGLLSWPGYNNGAKFGFSENATLRNLS